jgi:flagellar basal-body rod modification protein FlgD
MSAISAATSVDQSLAGPTNRFSEMSTSEFIQIMFTELTNQDPLEPSDTGALLDQLNSIRSIESDMQLTEQLEALVQENQLASASRMIGKLIGGRTEDFEQVVGYVVSVIKQGDDIMLETDLGHLVPFDNVETIVDPSIFDLEDPEGDGEGEGDGDGEGDGEGEGEG